MSVNITVASTRSRSASSSRTVGHEPFDLVQQVVLVAHDEEVLVPGDETNRAPRIWSAIHFVSATGYSMSPSRAITRVGTWIAGRAERTSMLRFIS